MGAERFLQLFDWNSKSKKKLFSSKLDFPEQSRLRNRTNRSLQATGYDQVDEVESRAGSSVRGISEHSCASSVVDDDENNRVRGPSVVARLMGLNSMPTSNSSEPSSTLFFDAQSLHSSHYQRENMEFKRETRMNYSDSLDGQSRCSYNSKPRKLPGRPIEKFQSEVLPPRSAKSIPITQHKLLSPIKSSGMFFTGDAAHIMEAAAKIIESGSQAIGNSKMLSLGSSLLPIKVKDLKGKAQATQERPEMGFSFVPFRVSKEGIHAAQEKISSAQSSTAFRMRDREKVDPFQEKTSIKRSTESFRLKDKDRSDAIQEKTSAAYVSASFRMRDKESGDTAEDYLEFDCSSGSFKAREKERPDPPKSRLAQVSERPFESNAAKYLKGQSANKSWNASKHTLPLSVTSDAETTLTSSSNKGKSVSLAIQAKVNVQKREGMRLNSSREKEQQPEVKSQSKNIAKNIHKRSSTQNASSVIRQNNTRQNNTTDKGLISKPLISYSSSKKALTDDSSSLRPRSAGKSRGSLRTRNLDTEATHCESDKVNSVINVPRKKRNIGGGVLMEGNKTADNGQKKSLKSEASGDRYAWIEDSKKKGMDVVSFTFSSPMTKPSSGFNSPSQKARITNDLFQNNQRNGINVIGSDTLSIILEQKLRELTTSVRHSSFDDMKDPLKGVDEMDAFSSNHTEAKNLCHSRLPSPVSILEGSFSAESCNSSRTINDSFEDIMPSSSVQACEVIRTCPQKIFDHIEADLSDSACSISPGIAYENNAATPILPNLLQYAPKWELKYVKDILSDVDIMFENFSAGITHGILNPQLFEELEISKECTRNDSNSSKLERKLYFDCVSEALDLRCKQYIGGGCKAWCKGMTMVNRKERLAEEVCKEISGLGGLSDCMVDELVNKDMSSQHGKWLNFESEEFSLGVEMEAQILNSLMDEMAADFLLH